MKPATDDSILSAYLEHFPVRENDSPAPEPVGYATAAEEVAGVTAEVGLLIQENIDPSMIAIIFSDAVEGDKLEREFIHKNIPFHTTLFPDALQQPFLQKVIHLFFYVDKVAYQPANSDHLLFDILHFDFYRLPAGEIAQLAIEAGKRTNRAEKSLYELMLEKAKAPAKDLFDPGPDPHLKTLALLLEKLLPIKDPQVLFQAITQDKTLVDYVNKNADSDWLKHLLITFGGFIKESINSDPGLQLHDFVEHLGHLSKERLALPVSKTYGNEKGVQLIQLTAGTPQHYDFVFVIGGQRLLVADKDAAGDFFRSLGQHPQQPRISVSFVEPSASAPDIISPEIAPLENSIIQPLLSKFVLSVSALNNFLDCPLGFLYKNLLRAPKHTSESMEFGSAVHFALEKLFRRISAENLSAGMLSQNRAIYLEAMLEDFNTYMQQNSACFTPAAFNRRLQYGEEVITNYYDRYRDEWNTVVSVERNISGVRIQGVPIKGKPDKLEFNGRDVTIIDYKTGNIEKALAKLQPPSAGQPNGGDYWRQAVFYKLLVDNYTQKDWKAIAAEFDFIEPRNNGAFHREKISFTPADLETVKHQITGAWAKIRSGALYTGCGEPGCHWCDLIKNNNRAIALHSKKTGAISD